MFTNAMAKRVVSWALVIHCVGFGVKAGLKLHVHHWCRMVTKSYDFALRKGSVSDGCTLQKNKRHRLPNATITMHVCDV